MFPSQGFGDLAKEGLISFAYFAKVAFAPPPRLLQGIGDDVHHQIVALHTAFHHFLLKRSNSHRRARCHSRCTVRNGRFKESAISSSVKPRKNFNSTTDRL